MIVGAGPGGCATALSLAKQGLACHLIDKAIFPRDKICGDALSGKVVEALNKLDPELAPAFHAEKTAGLPSWGINFYAPSGTELSVPFKLNYDASERPPGYISRRVDFDAWLLDRCRALSGVHLREGLRLVSAESIPGGARLTFAEGQVWETPLVIGADGAQSVVAKDLAGFRVEPKHYCAGVRQYYAGVSELKADGFIELHFHKRLLPGYLWIFPLPDGGANVGLGMRSDAVRRKKINLRALLPALLQTEPAFRARFSKAEPQETPKGFGLPLGSKQRRLSGPGFLLTGDAASLIDPFTGEGIGNALLSGILAGEFAARSLNKNGQSSAAALAGYDAAVYGRLWPELKLSRALQRLAAFPALFNFVVGRAARNPALRETISCMFEDLDLRAQFRDPRFWWRLATGGDISLNQQQ